MEESENFFKENGVSINISNIGEGDVEEWAEVWVSEYPDGSFKYHLDSEQLNAISDMFEKAADRLEEMNNHEQSKS